MSEDPAFAAAMTLLCLGSSAYHWLPDDRTGDPRHKKYRLWDEWAMYVVFLVLVFGVSLWLVLALITMTWGLKRLDSHVVLPLLGIAALHVQQVGAAVGLFWIIYFALAFGVRYLGERYYHYHEVAHPLWHVLTAYGLLMLYELG